MFENLKVNEFTYKQNRLTKKAASKNDCSIGTEPTVGKVDLIKYRWSLRLGKV